MLVTETEYTPKSSFSALLKTSLDLRGDRRDRCKRRRVSTLRWASVSYVLPSVWTTIPLENSVISW